MINKMIKLMFIYVYSIFGINSNLGLINKQILIKKHSQYKNINIKIYKNNGYKLCH